MIAINNYLKKSASEYFELLEKFVGINSYTFNPDGINQLGQHYADMYETLGFDSKFIAAETVNCGAHIVSTKKGKTAKNIILISHIDTVYPIELEQKEDHVWKPKGDLIFGPGTVDIKGGSVMIYYFLKALKEEQPELFDNFSWTILHNSGEEIGCLDFESICNSYINADSIACLVYEGGCSGREETGPILIKSRKGCLRFELNVTGRACHSSRHDQGANAIREMARIVESVEKLTDYTKGLTCSVGLINGGTAVNTVPDSCSCQVDVRVQTVEDYEWALDKLLSFTGEGSVHSAVSNFTCKVNSKLIGAYPAWPTVKEHEWLVKMAEEACLEGGRKLTIIEMGTGASDGNNVWSQLPVIDMLGPVGGNHHCPTDNPKEGKEPEFIIRDSIFAQALMNVRMVQKIADKFNVV